MTTLNTPRRTASPVAGFQAGVVLAGELGADSAALRQALAGELGGISVGRRAAVDALSAVGLFLIDPVAVVDAEDVRRLTELRSHAAAVALVCTRIDAFWDWPDALYASRELLDPDRRLPVFAVTAAGALDGDHGASGLPDLVAWIREQLSADAESLQRLASDSKTQAAIDSVRAEIRADESAGIARERELMVGRRDRGRIDRLHAVRVAAGRLRADLLAAVHSDSRAFGEAVAREVDRMRGRSDGFELWFRGQVERRAARVRRNLAHELAAWEGIALAGLEDASAAADADPLDMRSRPLPCRPVPTTAIRREDLMVVMLGASAGLGLGRLVVAPMAAVDTLQWVSMPLSLLLGFLVAGIVVRERRLAAARARLRGWAQDAVAELRAVLEQEVVAAIGAAESTLAGRIGRHYERRSRAIAEQVAQLDRSLGDARRRRADAEERLVELLKTRRAPEPMSG
jgi:hypothetical protein